MAEKETVYDIMQLISEHFDEIMKVWEELGDEKTLAEAAIVWRKRQEKNKL